MTLYEVLARQRERIIGSAEYWFTQSTDEERNILDLMEDFKDELDVLIELARHGK